MQGNTIYVEVTNIQTMEDHLRLVDILYPLHVFKTIEDMYREKDAIIADWGDGVDNMRIHFALDNPDALFAFECRVAEMVPNILYRIALDPDAFKPRHSSVNKEDFIQCRLWDKRRNLD